MLIDNLLQAFKHSLIDSLKVFIIIFMFYIILSFIETKITKRLTNNLTPMVASILGLIPNCGVCVIGVDLYVKRHISTGTLLALFISSSDEALLTLLADPAKLGMVIPLLLTKFTLAFVVGFTYDKMFKPTLCEHIYDNDIHTHCSCKTNDDNKFDKHLIHPFVHSLKHLLYIFIINFMFALLIETLGEDSISNFIQTSKYLSPLFACIIGLIPNCASSIIISELYLLGILNFGATLAGLSVNVGLGSLLLIKNENDKKKVLTILITLITVSLVTGYIVSLILNFS